MLLYYFLLLIEILLLAVITIPLAIFAPLPAALIIIVLLLLSVIFFRPAKRFSRVIRQHGRVIARRYRPRAVPDGITLRPLEGLTPAEVFRLMELLHVVPADRRSVADFTATLLDLNRRGVLALRVAEGDDLLRADGMRVIVRRDLDMKMLAPHEQKFIRMLRRASGPATSIQLSAFADYVARAPGKIQRDTDTFRRLVDRSLYKRHLFDTILDDNSTAPWLLRRRIHIITPRGEQTAAMWQTYIRNICTHPYLDSYRPQSGEPQKAFAADAAQLLVDAAACGYCARAAEALMREYLFEPLELWQEHQYFSTLTETRTAFAGTENGESYFFLPLRHFETAIKTAVLHGTPEGRFAGFEEL